VTDNVETPPGSGIYITTTRRDGDQLVRGWEADVNYNLTSELNVGGSWGHVYSIYTNFGSAFPEAVGRRVNGIAPENGGAYLKYSPTAAALRGSRPTWASRTCARPRPRPRMPATPPRASMA
jgi:hypothetical protein